MQGKGESEYSHSNLYESNRLILIDLDEVLHCVNYVSISFASFKQISEQYLLSTCLRDVLCAALCLR